MIKDSVDNLLIQWAEERPDMDLVSLGIAVRIGRLASSLSASADQALGDLGLSLWEYDVLSALRRQGRPFELPATQLATETRMSTGAITNRVDRLVDKQLVERIRDATDRRSVIVRLTRAGRELIGKAIEARVVAADLALSDIGARKRSDLATVLRSLLAANETPIADTLAP